MEISKKEFEKWFNSNNQQIATLAMKNQWQELLSGQSAFFSPEELWKNYSTLSAEGFCLAVQLKPSLLLAAIAELRQRLSKGDFLPFDLWPKLMSLASYHLYDVEQKIFIRDFVAEQHFEDSELFAMIDSALRCVDRMPEWLDCASSWINQVSPNEEFCVRIKEFLLSWGRLENPSNLLVAQAFKKLSPEWAPLMIKALNNIPGPYRYDLSLSLFENYFADNQQDLVKSILLSFERDTNVALQQKLLDGIFNFFNTYKQPITLEIALLFVDGIKKFLIDHWAENCSKFSKFWDKFYDAPEMFALIRSAFGNDLAFVNFDKGPRDNAEKLKTPLYMLCYLPIIENADLCMLLLKVIEYGDQESRNLACNILAGKEDFLQLNASFDVYSSELSAAMQHGYPVSYEMKFFVSAITNSLVKFGPQLNNIEPLYNFVQSKKLNVPALNERYEEEIAQLEEQNRYDTEVLNYLHQH